MLCNLLFVLFDGLQVAPGFVRRLARASSSSSQACKVLSGPKIAFLTNLADLFIHPPADAQNAMLVRAPHPRARSRNLCSRKTVTFVTFLARDERL